MNKIDELIEKLCPNGVKRYILKDICSIYDGTHQTPQYTSSGIKFVSVENIKDLYSTQKYISKEDYEKYKVKPQRDDILMTRIGKIGECAVIELDEPLAYYVSLALLRPNQEVITSKFLKYSIEGLYGKEELYKKTLLKAIPIKINMGDIGKIKIAVPPLEIQSKIVDILDKFTETLFRLKELLRAELKARKKQYEYYRDELLTFKNENIKKLCPNGVESMYLRDIGQVRMCKRVLKYETNTRSGIPFYKIGTFGKKADAFISEEMFNRYKQQYSYPKKGDILISCSGTIGKIVVFDGEPAYFQDSNIVWLEHDESKVLNEYLKHVYTTQPWRITTGGTISRLYNDNILSTKILVPPLEIQCEIVRILNKFEQLYNSLSEGIPAEIEARQKQYEYYRDKLLTFKELVVD